MSDMMISAVAAGATIRAFACTTREMTEECRRIHTCSPVMTAAMGRLMSAGAMMGSMMKGEKDRLTLQISGDGPAGTLTVTADAKGNVKATADECGVVIPAKPNGKLDVSGAIGAGTLTVIRDLGLKEPYNGTVPLQTGEIAEDLTYYYAASEQIPSAVGLGVLMNKENTVSRAGGFIVQLLPFAPDDVLEHLEENLKKIPSVTEMLSVVETPEYLLERVLEGFDIEVTEHRECRYRCDCSRPRLEKVLISLGEQELENLIREQHGAEINCHFCGSKYAFSEEELKTLLEASRQKSR
jgi:molecular chaperone Hsp33